MAEKRIPQKAYTETCTHVGLDGFERTALVVERCKTASVDVLRHDGTLLCRVNVSDFGPKPNGDTAETMRVLPRGNVDVIFGKGPHKAKALTFTPTGGRDTLFAMPESNLVAVDFAAVPESEW